MLQQYCSALSFLPVPGVNAQFLQSCLILRLNYYSFGSQTNFAALPHTKIPTFAPFCIYYECEKGLSVYPTTWRPPLPTPQLFRHWKQDVTCRFLFVVERGVPLMSTKTATKKQVSSPPRFTTIHPRRSYLQLKTNTVLWNNCLFGLYFYRFREYHFWSQFSNLPPSLIILFIYFLFLPFRPVFPSWCFAFLLRFLFFTFTAS